MTESQGFTQPAVDRLYTFCGWCGAPTVYVGSRRYHLQAEHSYRELPELGTYTDEGAIVQ